MKISAQQLYVLRKSLLVKGSPNRESLYEPRSFSSIDEQEKALHINREIKKNVTDGSFVDGDIELNTEQKSFCISLLNSVHWQIDDLEIVSDLRCILNK